MKILAVDSSSKTASAALLEDLNPIARFSVKTETHSAVLLPMIEHMLKAAKTAVRDLDQGKHQRGQRGTEKQRRRTRVRGRQLRGLRQGQSGSRRGGRRRRSHPHRAAGTRSRQ